MDIRDIIEQRIKPQIKQPLWESWYIKEKIGSGSFSVVYRIEAQRPGGLDVSALKVEAITTDGQLFTDSGRKTTFLNNRKQMAINEAQIMKKLRDCPNIVRYEEEHMQELYINGTFEGYYYLIRMELLQNVFDLMRNNKFNYSESNVRKLAVEIGQGLRAAHTHGIIHRDIKPDNMFVSKSGIYKLGDFNISKKAVSTRTYAGTQYYMAPEIYRAKANVDSSYTTQADIYSFGLCLYQMMNDGQLPFEDTLDPDTAYDKRMTERVSFPRPRNASQDFARIILKACAFDANARYKSIDDMLAELGGKVSSSNKTQYADSTSSITRRGNATQYADEDISPSHRQSSNGKSGKVIAGFVAAIVLIIGGVFLFPKLLKSNDNANDSSNSQNSIGSSDSNITSVVDNQVNTTSVFNGSTVKGTEENESVTDNISNNDAKTTVDDSDQIATTMVSLVDLTPINANDRFKLAENCEDCFGNVYQQGTTAEFHTYGESIWGEYGYSKERTAYAEYKTANEYEKITGIIAVSDFTSNELVGGRIEFLGDGELLNYYDVNRRTEPINFEINLKGIDLLRINLVYRSEEGYGDVYVLLVNPVLSKSTSSVSNVLDEDIMFLSKMKMINNNDRVTIIDDHTRNDVLGNIYSPSNLIEMNTYGESVWGDYGYSKDRTAYAEYYLGKDYYKLNGIIAVSDKTSKDLGAKVILFGDDVELAQFELKKTIEPINVDVDLSNISILRIELRFYSDEGYGYFYAFLSDFVLYK